MEKEDTTNGSFEDAQMNGPTPTFGYDTVALRTKQSSSNVDILGCCEDYDFKPQFALGFQVKDSAVLGNGDLVRTTFRAIKFRLSFDVHSRTAVRRAYWSVGSQNIFREHEHAHDHTLILLRHFKELWRPEALPASSSSS
mmetsp:Transcript_379/g.1098  ORF Transcript_379/g.1098 Transcript_379/m.1098 type:complete len:140 (-) Transcript_379:835-1254(-)